MSRYNIKNMKKSKFFCTNCGNEGLSVMRKKGQERESGHLKKMYCIFCKDEFNMVEIKDNGKYSLKNFKTDFENGVFINDRRVY